MVDFVVLKKLTLKSDLGWFKTIYEGHGLTTNQKAITLNKDIMNAIWPSLRAREKAYDDHKAAQALAKTMGFAGMAAHEAEKRAAKAIGTIPVEVELHGPGGKPALFMQRVIALQDKNWRLNGDFVVDPTDQNRFFPVMQEGDLALIGFDDVGWPANPLVVLLSATADEALWKDLESRVTKGLQSMIQMAGGELVHLADRHGLPVDHVVRRLANSAVAVLAPPPAVLGGLPAPLARARIERERRKRLPSPRSVPVLSPAELAEHLAQLAKIGTMGEAAINDFLADAARTPSLLYSWVSQTHADGPYDFEVFSDTGATRTVIDVKSTSGDWKNEFHMSFAEVDYAATSPVPYIIFRLSNVVPGKFPELWQSADIRLLAARIRHSLLRSLPPGVRPTSVAIRPCHAATGIRWNGPQTLPQLR